MSRRRMSPFGGQSGSVVLTLSLSGFDPSLPFVSISCRSSEAHFDPFLTCEPTDVVAPIHPKAMPVIFSVSPGAKCQVTLALMAQANAELESLLA
jgi:hypothetical protein